MGKRHLTKTELLKHMNMIARESRIADRSTWTAMNILYGHCLMTKFGFKGKRINAIISLVNNLYEMSEDDDFYQRIKAIVEDKTKLKFIHEDYTEDEIAFRKGTFGYLYHAMQLPIKNRINSEAMKYTILFNYALISKHKFGYKRLEIFNDAFDKIREQYVTDKTIVNRCQKELFVNASIYIEGPHDIDKKYNGSLMTGKVVIG